MEEIHLSENTGGWQTIMEEWVQGYRNGERVCGNEKMPKE